MGHDELREALGRHLEGELASAERREVERHLAVCAPCRSELHELRSTVALLRTLPDPELPADLVAGVLRRLESANPRHAGSAARLRSIARGAALSAPLAAFAAGVVLLLVTRLDRTPLRDAGSVGTLSRTEARAPAIELSPRPAPSPSSQFAAAAPTPQPRPRVEARAPVAAPPAPPRAIDADALDTVALDPERGSRPPRARFAIPRGIGVAAAPAAPETGSGLPPRPAPAACIDAAAADDASDPCRPWVQGMLTLAQYDPRRFLDEIEALPEPEAVAWLTRLARFSRETRSSEGVASRLRATPDARVAGLARWFEPDPGDAKR